MEYLPILVRQEGVKAGELILKYQKSLTHLRARTTKEHFGQIP